MVNRDELIRTVRDETDPVRRIRLAGDAMIRLQQGEVELSRLRREAIEEAAEGGLTYSEIARQVDLTRGRVSQIRNDSPPPERAFFGVGPVTLGVPLRVLVERDEPLIATEDLRARDDLSSLLRDLVFHIDHADIHPDKTWRPPGNDLIAICGPKSSPVIAKLLADDPLLDFGQGDDGLWGMTDRITGQRYLSQRDVDNPISTDIAYLGRLDFDKKRKLVLIAGVHAIGSVGAVHYLRTNLGKLYDKVGTDNFSMIISSNHDGLEITSSGEVCPPELH